MFHFKQFSLSDDKSAMKIGTDAVLLGSWVEIESVHRILDVGTGSGIIALMMAQRTQARIDAVEIDAVTAEQANSNFAISPWAERIHIHISSVQHFAALHHSAYDLIISNPPFFANSLKSPDPNRSIARHNDSLPVNEFMQSADRLLNDHGKLTVIIPAEKSKSWIMEASIFDFVHTRCMNIIPRKGKPVHRVMMEFCRNGLQPAEEEILEILDTDGKYTENYKRLTSEFYLGL